ncbi:MAG: MaoC family dehydratase N-terminal domain-containing protein [Dehalococcoidia bacterium]
MRTNKRNSKKLIPPPENPQFDTGDIARWVGVPLGGSNMKDPVHVNDIRRWVQGMQNPNPLHFDEIYAGNSRFGGIVAPQSFVVATSDSGGGVTPAVQGRIDGTHGLVAADEWWFYGPRIFPGDKICQDRMLFDYHVAQTNFAGPALFSRGDTTYINQRGEIIAKQRVTVIRYRAEAAVKRHRYAEEREPEWTDEQITEIEKQRFDWINEFRNRGHDRQRTAKVGDKLTRRPIGPHTVMSLTTEWRSMPAMVWGAFGEERVHRDSTEGSDWSGVAGWLPELAREPGAAKIDPGYGDGLYHGPGRVHVVPRYAQLIGLPRRYGYGVCMGTWLLDYVTNWAGEWGEIIHSNVSFRSPAFVGDVAFIDGEVTHIVEPDPYGPIATVQLSMTNQRAETVATGSVNVRLMAEPDASR